MNRYAFRPDHAPTDFRHDFLVSTVQTAESMAHQVHQGFNDLVAFLRHTIDHSGNEAEIDEARERALPIIFETVASMAQLLETLDLTRHPYGLEKAADHAH